MCSCFKSVLESFLRYLNYLPRVSWKSWVLDLGFFKSWAFLDLQKLFLLDSWNSWKLLEEIPYCPVIFLKISWVSWNKSLEFLKFLKSLLVVLEILKESTIFLKSKSILDQHPRTEGSKKQIKQPWFVLEFASNKPEI